MTNTIVTILNDEFYTATNDSDTIYYSNIYDITNDSFKCRYIKLMNVDDDWNYYTTFVLGAVPLSKNNNIQFFLTKDTLSGTSSYYNIIYKCSKTMFCGSPYEGDTEYCNNYCANTNQISSNIFRAEDIRYNSNNQNIFYVFSDSGAVYQFVEQEIKDFDIDFTISSLYTDLGNSVDLTVIGNSADDYSDEDVKWYVQAIQEINGDTPEDTSEVFIGDGKTTTITHMKTGIYNIIMNLSTTFGLVTRVKTLVVSNEEENKEKEEGENKLLKELSLETNYNVYNQTDIIKIWIKGLDNSDSCKVKYEITDSQNHNYIFNTTKNILYFDTNRYYLSVGIATIKVTISCDDYTYILTKQIIIKEFSEVYIISNDINLYTDLSFEKINNKIIPEFNLYTYFNSPNIKITNKHTNNIQDDFVFAYMYVDKIWGLTPVTFNFEAVLNKECEHCLFEWLNGTDIFGYEKTATLTIENERVYNITLKLITPDYTLKYTTQLFVFDDIGMWYADLINKEVYYMVMQHKDIHIEDYETKSLWGKFKKQLGKITGLSIQKLKRRIK